MRLKHSGILIDSATVASYSPPVAKWRPSFSPMLLVSKLCFAPCRLRFQTGETRGEAPLQTMTQELIAELREWIDYNPETGVLTWKKRRRYNATAGTECGSLHHTGYRYIRFGGVRPPAHHIAWALHYGRWPLRELDHINRVREDNRITNLREVTRSENSCNRSMRSDSTTKLQGVSWDKRDKKWKAHVCLNGKTSAGYFTSLGEAAEWVRQKRAELHGEFAAQH